MMRGAMLAVLLALPAVAEAPAALGTIEVEIKHVDPVAGDVYVSAHTSKDTFPQKGGDVPLKIKVKASAATQTVTFEKVPYGVYAISVWHDVNANGKLETGLFGIPKEPLGVSRDAKGSFGPPKFDDAKFELKEEKLKLSITLAVP